jgi:hypothetical protein
LRSSPKFVPKRDCGWGGDELAFWSIDMQDRVEPARATVWIGPSSAEGESADFELRCSRFLTPRHLRNWIVPRRRLLARFAVEAVGRSEITCGKGEWTMMRMLRSGCTEWVTAPHLRSVPLASRRLRGRLGDLKCLIDAEILRHDLLTPRRPIDFNAIYFGCISQSEVERQHALC